MNNQNETNLPIHGDKGHGLNPISLIAFVVTIFVSITIAVSNLFGPLPIQGLMIQILFSVVFYQFSNAYYNIPSKERNDQRKLKMSYGGRVINVVQYKIFYYSAFINALTIFIIDVNDYKTKMIWPWAALLVVLFNMWTFVSESGLRRTSEKIKLLQ